MSERDTPPAFSRTGETNVLGKCTGELPKTKVPLEVVEILSRRAAEAGMTLTEYRKWRDIIDAYGLETVQRLKSDQLLVVAGMGRK